jgi:hypothetical protein
MEQTGWRRLLPTKESIMLFVALLASALLASYFWVSERGKEVWKGHPEPRVGISK